MENVDVVTFDDSRAVDMDLANPNASADTFVSIEGFILVKGIDDIVAVSPGIVQGEVGAASKGVGVSRHIEPVTSPALAEVG